MLRRKLDVLLVLSVLGGLVLLVLGERADAAGDLDFGSVLKTAGLLVCLPGFIYFVAIYPGRRV